MSRQGLPHLLPENKESAADDDHGRQEDFQDEGSAQDCVLDFPWWLPEGVFINRLYPQAAQKERQDALKSNTKEGGFPNVVWQLLSTDVEGEMHLSASKASWEGALAKHLQVVPGEPIGSADLTAQVSQGCPQSLDPRTCYQPTPRQQDGARPMVASVGALSGGWVGRGPAPGETVREVTPYWAWGHRTGCLPSTAVTVS